MFESELQPKTTTACSVPRELLESLLDHLYELSGERKWWKDEPRCNYQRDYQQYLDDIAATEKILGQNNGDKLNSPEPKVETA